MAGEEDRLNALIISEIESLRTDVREGFRDMRHELITSNDNIDCRLAKIKETYILGSTFWKVTAMLTTLITGAYGFTMFVLCKNML